MLHSPNASKCFLAQQILANSEERRLSFSTFFLVSTHKIEFVLPSSSNNRTVIRPSAQWRREPIISCLNRQAHCSMTISPFPSFVSIIDTLNSQIVPTASVKLRWKLAFLTILSIHLKVNEKKPHWRRPWIETVIIFLLLDYSTFYFWR